MHHSADKQPPSPDWHPDDPLWRLLGNLPEVKLPLGFTHRVVTAAVSSQTSGLRAALRYSWERVVASGRAVLPPKVAVAAAFIAAFSALALQFFSPFNDSLTSTTFTQMQEEDFYLVKNLDLLLANDEGEQWLYARVN